jgi:hypothetical protein
MLQLPAGLADRAGRHRGASGRHWSEQLPAIMAAARRDWSLTPGPGVPLGKQLSLLMGVTTADGGHAVLKASYPGAGGGWEGVGVDDGGG